MEGESAQKVVRDIQRKTRRRFSAEEKIRIVLEGLRGEESIAALCRREGLAPNLYYRWSKEFLEAGKKRLLGNMKREASAREVKDLPDENDRLKHALAETVDVSASSLAIATLGVADQGSAQSAIGAIITAIETIATKRGSHGAVGRPGPGQSAAGPGAPSPRVGASPRLALPGPHSGSRDPPDRDLGQSRPTRSSRVPERARTVPSRSDRRLR